MPTLLPQNSCPSPNLFADSLPQDDYAYDEATCDDDEKCLDEDLSNLDPFFTHNDAQ